jgi:hypothetical protein
MFLAAGLLTAGLPAADATTLYASTFTGGMVTGPLGDPCTPYGGDCLTELIDLSGQYGYTVGFAFWSTTCVGAGAHTEPNELPMAPPLCMISASGILTGYCGRAYGYGNGVVTLLDPLLGRAETFPFTWQLTWSGTQYTHNQMVLTGTITRSDGGPPGTIFGRLSITPDSFGGSCTNATATRWIAWGDWAFEIVDPLIEGRS